jgi:hypothetical protein
MRAVRVLALSLLVVFPAIARASEPVTIGETHRRIPVIGVALLLAAAVRRHRP